MPGFGAIAGSNCTVVIRREPSVRCPGRANTVSRHWHRTGRLGFKMMRPGDPAEANNPGAMNGHACHVSRHVWWNVIGYEVSTWMRRGLRSYPYQFAASAFRSAC
jgi:hypothetical protein